MWQSGGVRQEWNYATTIVVHKKNNQTECDTYQGITLTAHAGKVLLTVIANRLSNYCERKEVSPEEQCGFRPQRSTIDMIFVVR